MLHTTQDPYADELSGLDILGHYGPAAHTAWVKAGCPPVTAPTPITSPAGGALVSSTRKDVTYVA